MHVLDDRRAEQAPGRDRPGPVTMCALSTAAGRRRTASATPLAFSSIMAGLPKPRSGSNAIDSKGLSTVKRNRVCVPGP